MSSPLGIFPSLDWVFIATSISLFFLYSLVEKWEATLT